MNCSRVATVKANITVEQILFQWFALDVVNATFINLFFDDNENNYF
jgi:hypothetical protein